MPNKRPFLPPSQSGVRNLDRLLPSQVLMKQFFTGDEADFDSQLGRVTNSVLPVKSVHEKWDIQLKPGVAYEALDSDLSGLHFLQVLVRFAGFKHVLEVGTYIGVSTLFLAEAVGEDGRVVTVEVAAEFAEMARENFRRNGLLDRIELIHSDIDLSLAALQQRAQLFDMVRLDGEKANYARLLPPLLNLLRPGGLMLVDDIFCNGDTLNPDPVTDEGQAIRDMLRLVAALGDEARVLLPYGNGRLLLLKAA
jgi:predicted O-methyltransferase YrrM